MMEFRRMNNSEEIIDEVQKKFLKRHWKMTIVMAVSFTAAVIVALLVFLSVVTNALETELVPAALGQWTVGYIITFMLNVIFWELVFVGSWVIPMVGAMYWWYTQLPDEERKAWPQHSRREDGDAISFLTGLAWLIIVWLDGRWNLAFQEWTFNDLVYSWISAFLWIMLIFGIPIAIIVIIWLIKGEMKKKTEEVVDEPSEETTD